MAYDATGMSDSAVATVIRAQTMNAVDYVIIAAVVVVIAAVMVKLWKRKNRPQQLLPHSLQVSQ